MINRLLLAFTLLALLVPAQAQDNNTEGDRQYVTDQLRLSLYEKASSQSKVIKLLQSGDLLIVDEINGPYARVTTPDGARGWVKRGFLVSNPTAKILLLEEQQKNANLFEELERLSNSKVVIDTYEKDMDKLVAKIEKLEASNFEARQTITGLEHDLEEARQPEEVDAPMPIVVEHGEILSLLQSYWKFVAGLAVVLILLTFLLSKMLIEARIKSRFHGIKIW